MSLMPYTDVRADRDFRRYRTTVVKCGAPGTVVALSSNWHGITYTVRFAPPHLSGATVTLLGLTDQDISQVREDLPGSMPAQVGATPVNAAPQL